MFLIFDFEIIFQKLKPGPFDETHIAIVLRELLYGLEYLHIEGKIHRDIKGIILNYSYNLIWMYYVNCFLIYLILAANILLSGEGKVKLGRVILMIN